MNYHPWHNERISWVGLSFVIRYTLELSWTRDPFDRLIAAHAVSRGWRLATSDGPMLDNLPSHLTLAL